MSQWNAQPAGENPAPPVHSGDAGAGQTESSVLLESILNELSSLEGGDEGDTGDAALPASDLTAGVDRADDAEDDESTYYASADEFYSEYLRKIYRRKIDGKIRVWAARWWEYDEAVIRIDALWRSWEYLRREPGIGMGMWLRDYADPHMYVLMDPQGPFAAADASDPENQCGKGEMLPYIPPPPGFFPE